MHKVDSLDEEKDPHHNKCPGYDTKQFDGEVPVMQELWEIHCHRSQVHTGPEW